MSSWWLGFTRDLHPDPSTAKKVPQLPRISKPKSFKNNLFSVENFIHWRSLKGTIVTLRRKIWDLWGKGGVFVFLTFWVFKASRKKPGLTIHTQRTVVICQIQKAIATVNANAASWKVREKKNPPSSGGSFRQGPKKHPAVLPEEVAMFNFYSVLVFIDSGKKVKQMGFRPWFGHWPQKHTSQKTRMKDLDVKIQQKRIQACSPFDFAGTTLMYYVHIRHGHPHLEPCNGTLLLHS